MISLKNVTKVFGDTVAVDDLTLDIRKGELFTFLGPNAAGKTTTIKMITGLLRPTKGEISVVGLPLKSHLDEVKKHISYIPDFPYLYEKLTPLEMFYFFQDIYEMEREKAGEEMQKIVELFNLEEYKETLIENLSHGIKQRVVIALSLFHDPDVIVVDEPMVGLDPKTAKLVKTVLRDRIQKGKTIFLSTHQLHVAQELADRIGIIHEGRLIAQGTLSEIEKIAGKRDSLEELFLEITEKI
ncbi:MAG: ABC transporter ATP-binding protein [Candidatus Aureabacteria bacterium]|nr:ABC transporter ATP-binding protein [Candidatus Auribacterota bacterium]